MRLALVPAKYPYGTQEAYFDRELRALAPHVDAIAIFPVSPPATARGYSEIPADVYNLGLASLGTSAGAIAALATRPAAAVKAVGTLLAGRYPIRAKLKNLAVVPLGLALGMRLRRLRIDHVHAYWLSTPASVAYVAAAVAGITWSTTAHLWDIYENNAAACKLRSARFVRAISARGRRDLLAAAPGVPASRIVELHVGVDVPAAIPARRTHAARPFSLLCAANLVRKKGHRDLLHALARLRDEGIAVHCVFAGDGELRSELERLAGDLCLGDCVTFRGHVAHDTVLAELGAGVYDAMALTSLELPGGLMEGIPVALMEAMALGVPVVTTATGSITELVDDTCGRVVPQGDIAAIAGALAELANDGALRDRLARAARLQVDRAFNVNAVAKALAGLLTASVRSVSSERATGSKVRDVPGEVWGQG